MTNRVIQLRNSDTAVYGDIIYQARGIRHDPVPPLIRQLLAEHLIGLNDTVEVRRGNVLCFKPRRAKRWANCDIVDDPRDGLAEFEAFIGPHVTLLREAPRPPRPPLPHERRAV